MLHRKCMHAAKLVFLLIEVCGSLLYLSETMSFTRKRHCMRSEKNMQVPEQWDHDSKDTLCQRTEWYTHSCICQISR